MRPSKFPRRRKCCVCWSWFRPHATAVESQHVCGKVECCLEHRRRLAAERRRRDLLRHQKLERVRQRRRRRKVAEQARLSRATLPAQSLEFIDRSVEKLAEQHALSRATLRRQLMRAALISAGAPSTVRFWSSTVTVHDAPLAALTHWKLRPAAGAAVPVISAPTAAAIARQILWWLQVGVIAGRSP